jgi:hypothetical protein
VFRGRRLTVEVRQEQATYTLAPGDEPLEIEHWDETVALEAGTPVSRPIPAAPDVAPPKQPPGREPLRAHRS